MSLFYAIPLAMGCVAAGWLALLLVGWIGTLGGEDSEDPYAQD